MRCLSAATKTPFVLARGSPNGVVQPRKRRYMLNLEANIVRIRTELGVRNGTETIVRIRTELGVRIEPNPTLGIGYRVHFFTAGSEKTASQQGLPYREGFGEAFSQLRWHFK